MPMRFYCHRCRVPMPLRQCALCGEACASRSLELFEPLRDRPVSPCRRATLQDIQTAVSYWVYGRMTAEHGVDYPLMRIVQTSSWLWSQLTATDRPGGKLLETEWRKELLADARMIFGHHLDHPLQEF